MAKISGLFQTMFIFISGKNGQNQTKSDENGQKWQKELYIELLFFAI